MTWIFYSSVWTDSLKKFTGIFFTAPALHTLSLKAWQSPREMMISIFGLCFGNASLVLLSVMHSLHSLDNLLNLGHQSKCWLKASRVFITSVVRGCHNPKWQLQMRTVIWRLRSISFETGGIYFSSSLRRAVEPGWIKINGAWAWPADVPGKAETYIKNHTDVYRIVKHLRISEAYITPYSLQMF